MALKKIFYPILILSVIALLVYTSFSTRRFTNTNICQNISISIEDSSIVTFITPDHVEKMLKKSSINPLGEQIARINTANIRKLLLKNEYIKEAKCFISADNSLNVFIWQRLPLVRVFSENGKDYYLDETGHKMPPKNYPANLVVATGKINDSIAKSTLIPLGKFIRTNSFWNAQIEQIIITPQQKIELLPRVGSSVIILGDIDSLDTKMRNLRAFYNEVLSKVGWNKYAEIDLTYPNQVLGRNPKKL